MVNWNELRKGDIVTLEPRSENASGRITIVVEHVGGSGTIYASREGSGFSLRDWEFIDVERMVPEPPVGSVAVFMREGYSASVYRCRVSFEERRWELLSGYGTTGTLCVWASVYATFKDCKMTVVEP